MARQHYTNFDPAQRVVATGLLGTVQHDDVVAWEEELTSVLDALSNTSTFSMLFDLSTYEPGSLVAHKAMRTVVPEALARHGMRPAYLDLFEPIPEMTIASDEVARCVAFANVHHNADRMVDYEQRAGKPDQRFFSDLAAAHRWIGELS